MNSSRTSGFAIVFALIAFFVTATLFLLNETLPLADRFLAALIAAYGSAVLVKYLNNPRHYLPLFEATIGYMTLTFGWVSLLNVVTWYNASPESVSGALQVSFWGMLCLNVGYIAFRFALSKTSSPRFDFNILNTNLKALATSMLLLAMVLEVAIQLHIQASLLKQISIPLRWCGFCLLWIELLSGNLNRSERILVYLASSLVFLIESYTASLKPFVIFFILIGYAYWRSRMRVPWHLLLIVGIGFAALNPVKHEWRRIVWYQDYSAIERLQVLANTFSRYYFSPNLRETDDDASKALGDRLCNVCLLARVVEYTPAHRPYLKGETLKDVMKPRFLFPDKPSINYGNWFGRHYNFIPDSDRRTIISIPWFADLYQNFGTIGVIVGSATIGALIGALVFLFGSIQSSRIAYSIGIGAAGLTFFAGEGIAMVWGGIFLKCVLLLGFCWGFTLVFPQFLRARQFAQKQN